MPDIEFSHTSVLLYECIEALNIRDGYTYVDCTAGGGGHSIEIAKRMGKNSRLICFDRDKSAICAATERLKDYLSQVTFINDNFSSLDSVIKDLKLQISAECLPTSDAAPISLILPSAASAICTMQSLI